jgi:hypothetical protein
MYGGGCNFDLPTPVCENYVRPFPPSGSPTRSPITIGERVLEQELPNDSQGSPIPPYSAHRPFLALYLMFYPHTTIFPPHARNSSSAPGVSLPTTLYNFRFINLSKEFHCLLGFKSRQVSTSRDPEILSVKTKRYRLKFVLFLL